MGDEISSAFRISLNSSWAFVKRMSYGDKCYFSAKLEKKKARQYPENQLALMAVNSEWAWFSEQMALRWWLGDIYWMKVGIHDTGALGTWKLPAHFPCSNLILDSILKSFYQQRERRTCLVLSQRIFILLPGKHWTEFGGSPVCWRCQRTDDGVWEWHCQQGDTFFSSHTFCFYPKETLWAWKCSSIN